LCGKRSSLTRTVNERNAVRRGTVSRCGYFPQHNLSDCPDMPQRDRRLAEGSMRMKGQCLAEAKFRSCEPIGIGSACFISRQRCIENCLVGERSILHTDLVGPAFFVPNGRRVSGIIGRPLNSVPWLGRVPSGVHGLAKVVLRMSPGEFLRCPILQRSVRATLVILSPPGRNPVVSLPQ
jgi:hypothetical protein